MYSALKGVKGQVKQSHITKKPKSTIWVQIIPMIVLTKPKHNIYT